MVRPARERLSGWVEVDEAYVGGVEGAVHGRETATKSIVAIAVEIKSPKGFGGSAYGRSRTLHRQPDPVHRGGVEPARQSTPMGGRRAYWAVPEHGYTHERTVMRKQSDPAHVVMLGVHRVASLLQRWLLGTRQGAVGPEHLDACLNEFTFRFNRRRSRRRGMLFSRLLEQSIAAEPITYSSLIANPKATGRDHTPPSRPGRVAPIPVVCRPWRQTPGETGPPDLNG